MAKTVTICLILLASLGCDKPEPKTSQDPPSSPQTAAPVPAQVPVEVQRQVIDVHTHMSPIVYQLLPEITATNGIQRYVNLSGGYGDERVTEHLADLAGLDERVVLFSNIDWEGVQNEGFGKSRAADLKRYTALGTAGLKVSKHLGLGVVRGETLVAVDDPALAPIWAAAGELGIPVSIHTSDPKAFFEPLTPDNERYGELSEAPSWSFHGEKWPSRDALLEARDRMVKLHPDTTFILVHFANNPEDIEYVDRLLDTYPNAYVDLSARIGEIGRHPAKRVREIIVKHRKRILFGTDIMLSAQKTRRGAALRLTLGSLSKTPPKLEDIKPFYDAHWRYFETGGAPIEHPVPIQGPWKVNPIELPPDVLDDIYFRNAERVIFAPHFGRRLARRTADTALSLTKPHEERPR